MPEIVRGPPRGPTSPLPEDPTHLDAGQPRPIRELTDRRAVHLPDRLAVNRDGRPDADHDTTVDSPAAAVANEAIVGNDIAPARLLEPAKADLLSLVKLGHVGLRTMPIGRYTTFIQALPVARRRAVAT